MFDNQKISDNIVYGKHDRYWIPINDRNIMSFYLNHLVVPHSRKELLRTNIARTIPFKNRNYMLSRSYPGKRNKEAPDKHIMNLEAYNELQLFQIMNLVGIKDLLEEKLRQIDYSFRGPLNLLILEDYKQLPRSQKVLFIFDQESNAPCAVAKVNHNAKERSGISNEYSALMKLNGQFGTTSNTIIPEPLVFFEDKGLTLSMQTFLPGRSIYFELRNSWFPKLHASRHFRLARQWLVKFHLATKAEDILIDEQFMKGQILTPLEDFQRDFNACTNEQKIINYTMLEAEKLLGQQIPLVARQGDFWARNIIIKDDKVGVVDWEHYVERSTPFTDLFMFPVSYCLNYPLAFKRSLQPADAFRSTFLSQSWLSQLVKEYFHYYCDSIGISRGLLQILFTTFLIERTLEENNQIENGNRNPGTETWRELFREYATVGASAYFF